MMPDVFGLLQPIVTRSVSIVYDHIFSFASTADMFYDMIDGILLRLTFIISAPPWLIVTFFRVPKESCR